MKLIIAGCRDMHDPVVFRAAMEACPFHPTEIVQGGAPGVDTLASLWGAHKGIPVKEFKADWDLHGRSAGPIRNRQMALYADALLAIWDGVSRGTKNMIDEAKAAATPTHVHLFTRPLTPSKPS